MTKSLELFMETHASKAVHKLQGKPSHNNQY